MAVTARTWVEGEIATAAKFNTIRDDLHLLDAIAGIRTIQYGTISLSNTVTTNSVAITAVTVAKAVLHHLGQTVEPGSGIADGLIRITLTNSTTVTATRAGVNNLAVVGFCVEEHK